MTEEMRAALELAMNSLKHTAGEGDQDDACIRVCRRILAEVLGLPLDQYRLLKEPEPQRMLYYTPAPDEPSGDDEAHITEMSFKAKAGEPIEAYAQFEGGPVKAFAVSLVQWFRESGGQNYVTCDLRDPDTGEAYSITMQKAGGRTPAQDLNELRSQLNRRGES